MEKPQTAANEAAAAATAKQLLSVRQPDTQKSIWLLCGTARLECDYQEAIEAIISPKIYPGTHSIQFNSIGERTSLLGFRRLRASAVCINSRRKKDGHKKTAVVSRIIDLAVAAAQPAQNRVYSDAGTRFAALTRVYFCTRHILHLHPGSVCSTTCVARGKLSRQIHTRMSV